jgi:hypothetical protein
VRLSQAVQFLAALPRDRLTGPLFAAGAAVSKQLSATSRAMWKTPATS